LRVKFLNGQIVLARLGIVFQANTGIPQNKMSSARKLAAAAQLVQSDAFGAVRLGSVIAPLAESKGAPKKFKSRTEAKGVGRRIIVRPEGLQESPGLLQRRHCRLR